MGQRPEARVPAIETFLPEPASLGRIRSFLRSHSEADGLPDACAHDLVLAAGEAASNAILHANGTIIRITWTDEHGCACVVVADDGVFRRDPSPQPGDGGRGVPLMMALVDEVSIREGTRQRPGTVVRLVKCCARLSMR